MITVDDCIALSGLMKEEVDIIAAHEGLDNVTAAQKGAAFLCEKWGAPAIRQMIADEITLAKHNANETRLEELQGLLERFNESHPGGVDRRQQPRDE